MGSRADTTASEGAVQEHHGGRHHGGGDSTGEASPTMTEWSHPNTAAASAPQQTGPHKVSSPACVPRRQRPSGPPSSAAAVLLRLLEEGGSHRERDLRLPLPVLAAAQRFFDGLSRASGRTCDDQNHVCHPTTSRSEDSPGGPRPTGSAGEGGRTGGGKEVENEGGRGWVAVEEVDEEGERGEGGEGRSPVWHCGCSSKREREEHAQAGRKRKGAHDSHCGSHGSAQSQPLGSGGNGNDPDICRIKQHINNDGSQDGDAGGAGGDAPPAPVGRSASHKRRLEEMLRLAVTRVRSIASLQKNHQQQCLQALAPLRQGSQQGNQLGAVAPGEGAQAATSAGTHHSSATSSSALASAIMEPARNFGMQWSQLPNSQQLIQSPPRANNDPLASLPWKLPRPLCMQQSAPSSLFPSSSEPAVCMPVGGTVGGDNHVRSRSKVQRLLIGGKMEIDDSHTFLHLHPDPQRREMEASKTVNSSTPSQQQCQQGREGVPHQEHLQRSFQEVYREQLHLLQWPSIASQSAVPPGTRSQQLSSDASAAGAAAAADGAAAAADGAAAAANGAGERAAEVARGVPDVAAAAVVPAAPPAAATATATATAVIPSPTHSHCRPPLLHLPAPSPPSRTQPYPSHPYSNLPSNPLPHHLINPPTRPLLRSVTRSHSLSLPPFNPPLTTLPARSDSYPLFHGASDHCSSDPVLGAHGCPSHVRTSLPFSCPALPCELEHLFQSQQYGCSRDRSHLDRCFLTELTTADAGGGSCAKDCRSSLAPVCATAPAIAPATATAIATASDAVASPVLQPQYSGKWPRYRTASKRIRIGDGSGAAGAAGAAPGAVGAAPAGAGARAVVSAATAGAAAASSAASASATPAAAAAVADATFGFASNRGGSAGATAATATANVVTSIGQMAETSAARLFAGAGRVRDGEPAVPVRHSKGHMLVTSTGMDAAYKGEQVPFSCLREACPVIVMTGMDGGATGTSTGDATGSDSQAAPVGCTQERAGGIAGTADGNGGGGSGTAVEEGKGYGEGGVKAPGDGGSFTGWNTMEAGSELEKEMLRLVSRVNNSTHSLPAHQDVVRAALQCTALWLHCRAAHWGSRRLSACTLSMHCLAIKNDP